MTCQACPYEATCCNLVSGVLIICGCPSGQSIDAINNICYDTCSSNSYYDSNLLSCLTCQANSYICDVTINGVQSQTCCCSRGYELDSTGTFCQKSCGSSQYLDVDLNECFSCPAFARTCPFGIIETCNSGYTLDAAGNVCYRCNSGQAYDASTFQCANCPTGVSCCTIFDGFLESICGCSSGYTLDEFNLVCYRCNSNQYYDLSFGECVNCPSCATSCNIDQGFLEVTGLVSG